MFIYICCMRIKDPNKIADIFKACLRLTEVDGLAGLTMAGIAKKAGIATGTLYIYFRSKEDLVNELYQKLEKNARSRFVKGYSKEQSFREALKTIWNNYLIHRINYHDESVFLEQFYRSPYIDTKQMKLAESMKSPVLDLIKRGQEEGVVKSDVEKEMLFLAMLGFIRELGDEHVKKIYILTPERMEKAFNLSWDTIKR